VLSLREFVMQSYRGYAAVPKSALANRRTDAMMADGELVRALRTMAEGA
jgi:hypothetical protein